MLLIVTVAILIVGLYYLMSPYQNCMRGEEMNNRYGDRLQDVCFGNTNW